MGLPGVRGIEHVGITVPDLDRAVSFFTDVLGCEFVFDGGSFRDAPDHMEKALGVHREAGLRYCFLRCGHGPNLEVFEYSAPDQNPTPPKNSDVGGHHLCFYVDDIEAAVAFLRARDVPVMGEINRIEEGPAAGAAWVYFLAPWGLQLELGSFPQGKGPPGGPARRLWHPIRPER